MKHLFLGGARSGKSQLAEAAVLAWQQAHPKGQVVYVATSQKPQTLGSGHAPEQESGNHEMQVRIQQHQARRPSRWQLLEEPLELGVFLNKATQPPQDTPTCVIIDCLTLWLTNVMFQGGVAEANVTSHAVKSIHVLQQAMAEFAGELVIVSNEVGSGIVPMGAINRQFSDLSGTMNQRVAGVCDTVTLAVAGLPLVIKQP